MGARDYWDRMLIYFGIAEELEDGADRQAVATRTRESSSRSAGDEWDAIDEPQAGGAHHSSRRRATTSRSRAPRRPMGDVRGGGVGFVSPRTFNDAQKIADQFKRDMPVIINFQQTDGDLAKRIIDFTSGLTYGLDGAMQRIADRVFLLTPAGVEVTAEDRAAMIDSGFFNQS